MSTTTTPAALEAFTRAVIDDYTDGHGYPDGAVVLPAEISLREFVSALKAQDRDPGTTPIVFVRADGLQMVTTPRAPRSAIGRLLATVGITPMDIEIREAEGSRTIYRTERLSRGPRDLVRHEHRAFAGAC